MDKYSILKEMAVNYENRHNHITVSIFVADLFLKIFGPYAWLISILEEQKVGKDRLRGLINLFNDGSIIDEKLFETFISIKFSFAVNKPSPPLDKIKYELEKIFCESPGLAYLILVKYKDNVMLYM